MSTEIGPYLMKRTLNIKITHNFHVEVKRRYKGLFIKITSNQLSISLSDPFHIASKINSDKADYFQYSSAH